MKKLSEYWTLTITTMFTKLDGERMRIRYDEKSDAVYIRFSEAPCFESDEIKEGFIIEIGRAHV